MGANCLNVRQSAKCSERSGWPASGRAERVGWRHRMVGNLSPYLLPDPSPLLRQQVVGGIANPEWTTALFGCNLRPMPTRSCVLISVALGIALGHSSLLADVIAYRLEFNRTGRSVNYPNPQDGYLVVDIEAGTANSIVLLDDPDTGEQYYTTGLFSGQYFTVTSGGSGTESDVVSAGNAGAIDSAALQVSGRKSSDVEIGGGGDVDAARRMVGFALMSGADAVVVESEGDDPDEGGEESLGYVGTARVNARFAESDTKNFNDNGKSASEAIAAYAEFYDNAGISSGGGDTPNPPPVPGPIPDPDVTPTPEPFPTPTPNPFGF